MTVGRGAHLISRPTVTPPSRGGVSNGLGASGGPGIYRLSQQCPPSDARVASQCCVAAASRRQEELPGLVETLQDDVVLTTGGTSRPAYGWFAEGAWRYGDRHVHELFLNADPRPGHRSVSAAEGVLVTLLHEACHVWAQLSGVRDTSRDGRYHNRRFAESHSPLASPWRRTRRSATTRLRCRRRRGPITPIC